MRDDDKPDILTRFRLRKLLDQVETLRGLNRPEWLRLAQERTGLIAMPPMLFLVVAATWALVAVTLFLGFYAVLMQSIFQDPPEGQEAVWNWRFSIAQLVAVTTVLGAVIALPITLNRLVLTRRQTEAAEKDHLNSVQGHITDRINKAVLGLGEDKERNWVGNSVTIFKEDEDGNKVYSRTVPLSVEDTLSLEDREKVTGTGNSQVFTETYPNLEVRIGAIFALERIAQDSDRDHVQIMEILCAYIRQNAPAPKTDDWPKLKMKKYEDDGPLKEDWEKRLSEFKVKQETAKAALKLREDIQVALTVIGRRDPEQRKIEAGPGRGKKAAFPFDTPCPDYEGPEDDHDPAALDAYRKMLWHWRKILDDYTGYRLDLRDADLRGADLSNAQLQAADLASSQLQGADLKSARLQAATPTHAQLLGANLELAQCQASTFENARLQGANLTKAGFQEADLTRTKLQSTHFSMVSKFFSARDGKFHERLYFKKPSFQSAEFYFKGPNFQGAELSEVKLYGIHWSVMFDDDAVEFEAIFRGSALRKTDLPLAPIMSRHLASIFGDASVRLPAGPGPGDDDWSKHWPKFELDFRDFHDEWRKWQADPETYQPPDPPKSEDTA